MSGPLDGVRVLEFAGNISAPMGTMLLGDQGADVIKVEAAEGDRMRQAGNYRQGVEGLGALFLNVNRNKRSIVLDLKNPADIATALVLASQCDVVVQNFRPGVMDRLGLGYDRVRAARPDSIYVSVNGMGAAGLDAGRRVYDPVIQGIVGFAGTQTDRDDGVPRMVQNSLVDKATALQIAQATSAALFHRQRTGQGQHIEISMLKVGLAFLWPDGMSAATLTGEGVVQSASVRNVRYIFPTRDDYIIVSHVSDMEWAALCQAVDRPDLIEDGRFRRQRDRGLNRAAINAELADAFLNRTTAEWLVILRRFDANFAPVNRPQTIHLDPNIQASGAIADLLHPTAGPYRQPRHPADFSETPAAIGRHAPRLGEHTAEILAEFGATDASF